MKAKIGLVVLVLVLVLSGCDNPFGTDDDNGDDNLGTAPTITDVLLFRNEDFENPTLSFQVGDNLTFVVFVTDPDKDSEKLFITIIYPNGVTEEVSMDLPSSAESDMYFFNLTPVVVENPTGAYQLKFRVRDQRGNMSNEWTTNFVVSENVVTDDPSGETEGGSF